MKFKDLIKKLNIRFTGVNFDKYFLDMEVKIPKKLKLTHKILEKPMTDSIILKEFQPEEVNFGEFVYCLKNPEKSRMLKNDQYNIFYIRSENNILWNVGARWYTVFNTWRIGANFLDFMPLSWSAGTQLVQTKELKPDTSATIKT